MKVFGIGFQKTGTSTLGQVFEILGYKMIGPRIDLASDLMNNDFTNIFNLVDANDAFQDNPWPLLYKELDKNYPGSKFILTNRDSDSWINSVVNHFGNNHTDMRKWIYGVGHPMGNEAVYLNKYNTHYKEVKEYFKDRQNDFLEINWFDGDEWEKICNFLNKDIPNQPFPHKNKGNYSFTGKLLLSVKKRIRDIFK